MSKSLRVPTTGLHLGSHSLGRETSKYVAKVHRKDVGDELRLFDPEACLEAVARIEKAHPEETQLTVLELFPAEDSSSPIVLFQALGKGDKPDQAVRDATVLGARRVVLLETERTVAKHSGDSRDARLRRVAVECARQCGRGGLPSIEGPYSFADGLREVEEGQRFVFAFAEGARLLSTRLLENEGETVSLLIGPEGGLSNAEVELSLRLGFVPTSLGPLVLRTETAATVALSLTRARFLERL
jgi:16S rRNA (uracil1498-N3)-methyltransferase